mmetsp:Transcript_23089/g.16425  ORF Transcript_23089/g.16425 Transcript_23089/m.16425 type:complete len:96 (-) Transcript_23089:213-500(-)
MPNAFAVPKNINEITLNDIESTFPLDGEFIFRFKYKYTGASVWLDLSNKKCKVPKCDNKIIIKVTRKVPKNTIQYEQVVDNSGVSTGSNNIEEFF